MNYVYRYRAGVALGVVRKYTTTRPMLVMTGRSYNSDIAVIDGRQVIVPINSTIDSDNESDGWVHMSSGLGFINIEGLKEIGR
jgi:hypothetical protein